MKLRLNILFPCILLTLISCNEIAKNDYVDDDSTQEIYDKNSCKEDFVKEWTKEVLYPNKMYIKGKNLFYLTTDSLLQIFGKPDTIYSANITLSQRVNFEKKNNYWVYGNTFFGADEEGKCWLINLDFNSTDVIIETPFINLKKGMIPLEIMKVFPYSSSRVKITGNLWSGNIEIYATWEGCHGRWLLNFTRQELQSIRFI